MLNIFHHSFFAIEINSLKVIFTIFSQNAEYLKSAMTALENIELLRKRCLVFVLF